MTELGHDAEERASSDLERVRSRLESYCDAVDRQDASAVASLLAEAKVDFRGMEISGRSAIQHFYDETFSRSTAVSSHRVTNVRVTRATPRTLSYFAEYQRFQQGGDEWRLVAAGTYDGELVIRGSRTSWTRHRAALRSTASHPQPTTGEPR